MGKRKTPTISSVAPLTRPGLHGGVLQVGNPGNRGGGRQPSFYRALCRELIDRRDLIERLGKIASGELGEIVEIPTEDGPAKIYCETPVKEQRLAAEALLAYGVGKSQGVSADEVKSRMEHTVQLFERLPDDLRGPMLAELRAIWA